MTTAAATTPAPRELHSRRLWLVLGSLLLGMLLAALDQTIVSTALPTIVGDLGGLNHYSWVVTAYLLASTASTPLWGKLGDLYGRKSFLLASITIFLVGSALSGISSSMDMLIAFRAIQGLGGGGLMVSTQAIVGDVVSPRDRGRYQGLFGAVFGVTTVVGPLLGGFFVDNLSWHWVFYINLPLGIVALVVAASVLPAGMHGVRRSIDYLGTVLIGSAAVALVLFTTWGGTTYSWGSNIEIGLLVLAALLLVGFVWAERRAEEPVIPLRLFKNRVFSSASAVGFVIGFAMFGAITYLPQFIQLVKGVSPTESGLRLLPMMAGLLFTSIGAGQLISRWGRYRVFPIAGTAITAFGLYLLSNLAVATSTLTASLYMFVLGFGLGMVMQVLVIAVQNAVEYRDLGVGTSGATFFRQIGGSFGVAVFGAIFTNRLTHNLAHYLGANFPPELARSASPEVVKHLPPAVHAGFTHAYAASLGTVFLVAVPVAAVAFALSWLLPEVPLRQMDKAVDLTETFAAPTERTTLQEIERALVVLVGRESRHNLYTKLAQRAGLELAPVTCWLLYRLEGHPEITIGDLAGKVRAAPEDVLVLVEQAERAGLLRRANPGEGRSDANLARWRYALTDKGHAALGRLLDARREGLAELLGDYSPEAHAELADLLTRLAERLLSSDDDGGSLVREPREEAVA